MFVHVSRRDLALLFLRGLGLLRIRAEAAVARFTSVRTKTQGIQNDSLKNATAFCPVDNSRFALRAGWLGRDVYLPHLIRVRLQEA
jgi:hypothetical protein